jgi:hypothetical protein
VNPVFSLFLATESTERKIFRITTTSREVGGGLALPWGRQAVPLQPPFKPNHPNATRRELLGENQPSLRLTERYLLLVI